ncbi:HNH endonuclease [Pseudarthrobacter sp. NPDC058329]|uniref:HNH endonuclease signature motif containing protein n=1 Tax=Pseudarthrobacter sp. NPDC058329 TaxID=3346448 RepID=UPI0036DA5B8D
MGNGAGVAAAMEGIHGSVARLDALFFEDAALETGASAGDAVDVLQRQYEIRLERMTAVKQLEAQLAAVKARDAAEALGIQHAMTPPDLPVHERTYAEMSAVEEIAGVLTISSGAAGALVSQARQLCALPLAVAALSAGTISWQHARIIADETEGLGPAGAAALAAHFLDPDAPNPARGAAPGELVPARFRAKVRTWRERHHPETLEKRHTKSAADRRMEYTPDRNGMAWISLHLPGDTACAIWNRTTALARGLQGPDEPRTMTQLRPDIAAGLLLAAPAAGSARREDTGLGAPAETDTAERDTAERAAANGPPATDGIATLGNILAPKADVLVTVPVFSLLGRTDEPALLDGYGPIPASMARKLVADGASSFYRVLVDPRDGAPLEIGRINYRLTTAMKKALRLRDGKCTFPGCNNNSPDNEADHLKAWQHGGTTGISNLAQLCPKHHRLKHHSGWKPTPATRNEPPGWTSPTGRHYKAEHHHWEPPHWPPGSLPAETPRSLPAEKSPFEDALVDLLTG